MQRRGVVLVCLAIGFLSGCGVSKDQYLKLEGEKKQLQQNVGELSGKVSQLEREKEELSHYNESLQSKNQCVEEERTESATKEEPASSEEPLK